LKTLFIFSLIFSFSAFAQLDESSSFEQYTEACQQGDERACSEGWYNKVTREIGLNESGEPTLNPKFLTKLEEVCKSSATMMCDAGLNMLSVPLDNANKEQAPGNEKANEIYNTYTVSNCTAIVKAGGESYFCTGILPKTDNKQLFINFVLDCTNSKDNAICEKGLKGAEQLNVTGEYLDNICKEEGILELPVCAERLQWKKNDEAKRAESDSFFTKLFAGIGLIAALFVGAFIFSTRCPSCKKFFALETIGKENLGTHFDGTETKNMKTGEIRDQNYNTVATIHKDVTFNVFKTRYKVTQRCKKCGYSFKFDKAETKKVRA